MGPKSHGFKSLWKTIAVICSCRARVFMMGGKQTVRSSVGGAPEIGSHVVRGVLLRIKKKMVQSEK